jgi:protein SCO1/2
MPFNVKDSASLTNLAPGTQITFRLHVTENESWVDQIDQLGSPPSPASDGSVPAKLEPQPDADTNSASEKRASNPLRTFKFTNELGQPISLSDFHGQALALTFFFTRCPIPEFCPRLSRNFETAQHKLASMQNAPTNWHLLSFTFDPDFDTPERLHAYGSTYHYDPTHWSFLTGPKDRIGELARMCDVQFDPTNGLFNHNFRTLIIDSSNRLQMVFPTSGDLSDAIVKELLRAAGGTNSASGATTNLSPSEK